MWSNSSSSSSHTFTLTGIPGLDAAHVWLSIPFTCIYVGSFMGNHTMLFVIRSDPSPHEPVCQLLSMLAMTDPGLPLSATPTVMSVFWANCREISLDACFAQVYFVHSFPFMESSVLMAMAFDRHVAICYPLRYTSNLTSAGTAKMGLAALRRCLVGVLSSLFSLSRWPFCSSHVLSHTYCLHQDLIQLVCADTTFNSMYGLAVVIPIVVRDPLLILLSYIRICKTIERIPSQRERLKASNRCLSHVPAVLILYIPMVGLSMVHRFGKNTSPLVHVFLANTCLLVPPVLNPITHSIKIKQIRRGILKVLPKKELLPLAPQHIKYLRWLLTINQWDGLIMLCTPFLLIKCMLLGEDRSN